MRNVCPSDVVSPISATSSVATRSAASKSAGLVPSYTNSTSMSDAYESSRAAETAHSDHRERHRRVDPRQRRLEARLGEPGELPFGDFEWCEAEEIAARRRAATRAA